LASTEFGFESPVSPQHPTPGASRGRLAASLDAVADVFATPAAANVGSPSVSVVVPTYQNRHVLGDVVAALDAQTTRPRYEVVIVDDGSTDGTTEEARHLLSGVAGHFRYVRLRKNVGRAAARNVGIAMARGRIIAFTDSDCVPAPGWIEAGLRGFSDPRIGIVQGPTHPHPDQPRPFFNHFIEIDRFDGTFSTCNVFYRREAVAAVEGFDPGIVYWEDLDLGWRVWRAGWEASYVADARVHHQVLPLSPAAWLLWPLHLASMPVKAARYPEYRRHLYLGVWTNWFHLLVDLALLSLPLGFLVNRRLFALGLPYLIAFPFKHGLAGRWPPVKALLHLAWDVASAGVLLVSSARHRSVVL
jgi:GT2 family glycosyltransferase